MTNILNITVDQGSSYEYTFNLTDDTDQPYSLTNYTARLQVRRTVGATSTELNATLANNMLVLGASSVRLVLAPADTTSIRFNNKDDETLECVYDLEIVSPIGAVYKPAKGTFTINREITR